MTMCCKQVPSLLVSHDEAGVEHMKVITRLHPTKTQHHVHNCLNLSSAVEANGVQVLTLLISSITFEMFFKELDISCIIECFLPRFSWIPLKRWTPLAKPFPLFIADSVLDNDGPSTSIGSKSTEGWHWGSISSLLSVESLDLLELSFGIWPLGSMHFFPLQPCLQTWFSWKQYSANFSCKWLLPRDIPTCVQPIVTAQYSCKQLR